jgi:hypothetical protein
MVKRERRESRLLRPVTQMVCFTRTQILRKILAEFFGGQAFKKGPERVLDYSSPYFLTL